MNQVVMFDLPLLKLSLAYLSKKVQRKESVVVAVAQVVGRASTNYNVGSIAIIYMLKWPWARYWHLHCSRCYALGVWMHKMLEYFQLLMNCYDPLLWVTIHMREELFKCRPFTIYQLAWKIFFLEIHSLCYCLVTN